MIQSEGRCPCWVPPAGLQLDLMGQSLAPAAFLPVFAPAHRLPRAAGRTRGGGGPTGALTSAQPIRGRPAEGWWRRAPDGRRRHAHSQRRLATGQGLPQGCLRAGRQAGRSHHGKAAAGARWPAWAGSTDVFPEGWRGTWTRGPHDAPDLATEGGGHGPEHLLCPGGEAPPDRPTVGRSKR